MTSVELKKRVIRRIFTIEDKLLLEEVSRLVGLEIEDEDVYILSEEQLKAVKEAKEQYLRGEYITNDDLEKEIEEWLKE